MLLCDLVTNCWTACNANAQASQHAPELQETSVRHGSTEMRFISSVYWVSLWDAVHKGALVWGWKDDLLRLLVWRPDY